MGTINLAPFLNPFVGDMGAGGQTGLVPAPPAGSAAGGDFLKADGSWAVPSGTGGGVTSVGTIDSQSIAANALTIMGTTIYAQSAGGAAIGMVNTVAQTFAGTKTFNNGAVIQGLTAGNTSFTASSNFMQTIIGTVSTSVSGVQAGLKNTITLAPNATNISSYGYHSNPSFIVGSGNTTTGAAAFAASLTLFNNVGTILNTYGYYYDGTSTKSGTLINIYGAYFSSPISGSSTSGNMALYADNFAVGYPNANLGGTNNAIFAKQVAIGTSVPNTNSQLTLSGNATYPYQTYLTGPLTAVDNSFVQAGLYSNPVFTPFTLSRSYGVYSSPIFSTVSGSVSNFAAAYSAVVTVGSGSGSNITGLYGYYFDGNDSLVSGSVVNFYGAYFASPPNSSSSGNLALYADNLSIGYPFVSLNGKHNSIFSGQVAIGTSVIADTSMLTVTVPSSSYYGLKITGTSTVLDSNSNTIGIYQQETLSPTSNASGCYGMVSQPDFAVGPSVTINTAASHMALTSTTNNSGSINNLIGYYYNGAGAISGSVSSIYGAYFSSPPSGNMNGNMALYADNLSIGYNMAGLNGTNSALFAGQVAIGSTPISGCRASLTINDNNYYYGIYFQGFITRTDGSNQICVYQNANFAPSSSVNSLYGIFSNLITTVSGTIAVTNAYANACKFQIGNSGAITNLIGYYYDGPHSSLQGTITNAYGAYISSPPSGSTSANIALYSDNLSVGYNGVNLNGTNNTLINGQFVVGNATPVSGSQLTFNINSGSYYYGAFHQGSLTSLDTGNNQYGVINNYTFNPSSGANNLFSHYSIFNGAASATKTIVDAGVHILKYNILSTNSGSIANLFGFYFNGNASAIVGTVTNAYGGYFESPPSGSTNGNIALYTQNLSVGLTGVNLNGTNNAQIAGKTITSQLQVTSGASNNFVMTSDASGNAAWKAVSVVTQAPSLTVYNSGSGTYTTPTNPSPVYLRVVMAGGGGGGGGSGLTANSGVSGGGSSFGTAFMIANGGGAGYNSVQGGIGGGVFSSVTGIGFAGSQGAVGALITGGGMGISLPGGIGGTNILGGAGANSAGLPGYNATPATGAGGGGGGLGSGVSGGTTAGGGGAGGYLDIIVTSISSSYTYVVGAGGAGGAAGTSGNSGGAGAAGVIYVYAYY